MDGAADKSNELNSREKIYVELLLPGILTNHLGNRTK